MFHEDAEVIQMLGGNFLTQDKIVEHFPTHKQRAYLNNNRHFIGLLAHDLTHMYRNSK